MSVDDLFAEARRQLTVCNACRYCEGYCAVFPALERRTLLDGGDVTHLANLCHDCRACFYACMYAPPHEFGINPPAVLGAVRRASYDRYVPRWRWPGPLARLGGHARAALLTAVVAVAVAALVALVGGFGALWPSRSGAASPYEVIAYPVLLVAVLVPCVWSVAVAARAGIRYWHDTRGPLRDLLNPAAVLRAARHAARLRYLRGGGDECYYPGAAPSPLRRHLHAALAYGFLACFASTTSAAVMQDVMGREPPYPYLSVPVLFGLAGGVAMVVGCTGLTVLKLRSDTAPASGGDAARDVGFLTALNALSVTGLLTLFTRSTPAFDLVLIVHLGCVGVAFAIFPYTRFMHMLYRFLAIVQDNLEREESGHGPPET